MKIVISHPHGNQNTSQVVKSLEKFNFLDSFWTTFAFSSKLGFFKKKVYDIEYKKVKLNIFKELFRQLCIFFKLKTLHTTDNSIFSVYSISKDLDLKVSNYLNKNLNNSYINGVYAYEDCALQSFKVAKKKNIKTFYDLTSPYWRVKKKIIENELKMHPDWNLSSLEIISENKCLDKDMEIEMSDKVIVASSFTAQSLKLLPKKIEMDVRIIPYGVNCPKKKIINRRQLNEKFKILFVGRPILSKGIHYLIKILNDLEFPWELEVAGSVPEKPYMISKQVDKFFRDDRCKFLGQISNNLVINKMKKSHVFLFPSLFEGFGQVILESMSCSLPTITTLNTCGTDIIEHKKNGYLTDIGDVENTKEILNNLYDNEELRLSIAENSYLNSKKYSWELYEKNLKNLFIN
tara:strand:+ start:1978 stop:3192 length:1215 start_codon:yes stop_codon:yes gene_type:complete